MACHHLVFGFSSLINNLPFYKDFVYEKYNNMPSSKILTTHATTLLALIHSNLCNPIAILSLKKTYYFVLFLDDYSHLTIIFFLKKKSEVFGLFLKYHCQIITQFCQSLLILQMDNGKIFINKIFSTYFELHGIN